MNETIKALVFLVPLFFFATVVLMGLVILGTAPSFKRRGS